MGERTTTISDDADWMPAVTAWRNRSLDSLLTTTALLAFWPAAYFVFDAIHQPQRWPVAAIFLALYTLVAFLAVCRSLPSTLRAWGFLLAWYAAGVLALISYGLVADGAVALLALPILAIFIAGRRVGSIFAVLSVLAVALAAALWIHQPAQLDAWRILRSEYPQWLNWTQAGIVFVVALTVLMVLQQQLGRAQQAAFQENARLYQESERLREFNESIVQSMEEGILLLDADGRIVFANPGAARQLDYAVEDLQGQHWQHIAAVESAAMIEQRPAQPQPGTHQYEATLLNRTGGHVPVLISAHPMYRRGQFDGLLMLCVDIRERKQVEQVLRENEERLRAILDASDEAVFLIDDQLTVLTVSPAAARMFRRSSGEMARQLATELLAAEIEPFERVAPHIETVRQVFRTGQPAHLEGEWSGRFYEASVYPIFSDRQVTQAVIFAHDITDRRQAEQHIRRTERLAAMGYLAAALAHEINNPLQAIRTNLELMLGFTLPPDEQKGRLGVVLEEIERLASLTKDMLEFAQPPLDTRYPVSLPYLVQRALTLTDHQMSKSHVQATTDIPDSLPILMVSPNQIIQVLLNLIINAIEAMPKGGHLHIAARADGEAVALTISNNGPALPPQHIERIFDPFFTTKVDGSGLGLPICHSIVRQHGGTINVENVTEERGVTFTIRLPVHPFGQIQGAAE